MKRIEKLFSNEYDYDALYAEYIEDCKDNGINPKDEDSPEFWDWVGEYERLNWEFLLEDFKYSKFNGVPVVVFGKLGLWDGTHEIEPTKFDNIETAIRECCSKCDYITIRRKYSAIEIKATHHDGTNIFELYFLNDRGLETEKGDLRNRRYHLTIKGYLFD